MRQEMENKTVYYERKEDVGIITLNRPEVLNAESLALGKDLQQALIVARADREAKVIILRGEGRAFCAGADIKAPPPKDVEEFRELMGALQDAARQFINLGKPIIAAVQGYAVGGGCELAMNCDIRIAAENAQFGFAEGRVGGIITNGGTQLMPRLVGLGRALELMFTTDFIDAQEALRIGLVNKVVLLEDLEKATWEMAKKIARHYFSAAQIHRALVYTGMEASFETALVHELNAACANWATGAREAGHEAWRQQKRKD